MRLDASYLHFITKQQLRILVAIEIGMRNHQYVPVQLIASIGNLRSGETYKTIRKLLKNKFVVHVGKKYDGYKLTYLGYDYLALHAFMKRGVIKDVICKIGVGKQSDIYKCEAPDGTHVVLKLTRLGRRSFKTIKNNREYIQNRTSFNWLYLSRLSSMREFIFMQVLHEDGFPTPKPIDTNRHAIVMSLIDGDPMCHIKKIGQNCSVKQIFTNALKLLQKFATRGLIHGDFNQFNLMINQEGALTVIDFPQCISSNHPNGQEYFNRDVECIYTFFERMVIKMHREDQDGKIYLNQKDVGFDVSQIPMPVLSQIQIVKRLDKQVLTKGHIKLHEQKQLEQYQRQTHGAETIQEQGQFESDEQFEEKIQEEQETQQNHQQFEKLLQSEQLKQVAKNQEQGKEKQKNHEENQDINQLLAELKELENHEKIENKQDGQQVESQQESQENEGSEVRQQWKGLTAYQIRQKLKQQKLLERQKKKENLTTQEYIKRALNPRNKNKRAHLSKGNYGTKTKSKSNSQAIKDGLEMGW